MLITTALRSFAIGCTCGLRSMAAPAVLRWRAGDSARFALAAMAIGELIADKLPTTPARTIPPALGFRAISGGFAGRSVAQSFNEDTATGTLAGVAGAIVASYAGLTLRKQIASRTGLPDLLVALAEDAVAVGGAIALAPD